jgi:hypothetical protein
MSANTSKSSNGSATTVWLIRWTEPDGQVRRRVFTHNPIADYRSINATVTPIDCAAVEELVEAVRSERKLAAMFDTGKMPTSELARAEERTDAALAHFGSAP